jgi:hypothetical protein
MLRLLADVVPLVLSYDTQFQVVEEPELLLYQMLYVLPSIVTLLATILPAGWTGPLWFSQIIISSPLGCPVVVDAWLNQMSYATS